MHKFKGTGVALVTPFKANKSVDVCALESLVNFQIDNGIDYLVVLGTTAESATLNEAEKSLVKDTVVEVADGRVPIVLGLGGNATNSVLDEINNTDFTGIDAILSVSPYYNRPSQEGIYQHFRAIAKQSPLPIILYNVPSRTGSNMLPETIVRLANNFENIIGVKEAAGDMLQAMRLIQTAPKDFFVTSGDDMLALPMVLAGGAGVISVIGQALPKVFSTIITNGLKGNTKEANKALYTMMSSIDLIFEEGNPSGIKAMLQTLNIMEKHVRLPLVEATVELQTKIDDFLKDFN